MASDRHERDEFLVSQYLDGTLSDDERRGLERRLAQEAALAAMLEAYREVDGLMHRWADDAPEARWADIETAVRVGRSRLVAPAKPRRVVLRWAMPLAAAAAIVLAATVTMEVGPWRGRVSRGPMEAMVMVHRPAAVTTTEESFVSYAYQGEDGDVSEMESTARGGVIALASVGGRAQ